MDIRQVIRDIPDFPQPGILFRDITPVLSDSAAFRSAVDGLEELIAGVECDRMAAIESRGFLFAAPLCDRRGQGLTILRKPGKLPADTISVSYDLEYGSATIEAHRDALRPGERVVIVDDLLATGGSAAAAGRLIRELGGEVAAYLFLVELEDLAGRDRLDDAPVFSLVKYR